MREYRMESINFNRQLRRHSCETILHSESLIYILSGTSQLGIDFQVYHNAYK